MNGMNDWQERENQRMREHQPGEDTVSRLSRENTAFKATIEKLTKDLAFAKDYVGRALASYDGDPANNDFQQGFHSALQVVLDEAFAPHPKPPTRVDRAFPRDEDYFCPGGYYIGSFVCKSCKCPKGSVCIPLEQEKSHG